MAKKDKTESTPIKVELLNKEPEAYFEPTGQYYPHLYDECPKDEDFYTGDTFWYSYKHNQFFVLPENTDPNWVEIGPSNFLRSAV